MIVAEVRERLVRLLSEVSDEYGTAAPAQVFDKLAVAEKIVDTLEFMLEGSSAPTKAEQTLQAFEQNLSYLGEYIYRHVNPRRLDSVQNWAGEQAFADYHGPGVVHLEMGTWIAWPEARAEEYVARRRIGDVLRLDMNPEFKPDVAASVTALPFRDNTIDTISSNSLFEHVPYPHDILMETFRVLKPGGAILTSVPFHFVQHDCPKDYLRFTSDFFQDICKDIGFVSIKTDTQSSSGVYYVVHQLLKAGIAARTTDGQFPAADRRAHVYVMGLLAAMQALDPAMVAGGASHYHTTHALAFKPGKYKPSEQPIDRTLPFISRHPDLFQCPKTWTPLSHFDNALRSADGSISYPLVDGVPSLVTFDGHLSTRSVMRMREQEGERALSAAGGEAAKETG